LTNRLGKALGFADHGVVTLDPAVGTGTYLLGVIEHALAKVQAQQGVGAVPGKATALAENVYGFEILVGPFAVSELRISRALEGKGAKLPAGGTHVYLTDSLESPNTPPPVLPFYLKPIAEQHARALKVKAKVPVIVCLGNPPYDRTEASDESNKARTGGWVRWGEDGTGAFAIFKAFLDPAIAAGHGVRVHNIYNLYVYFWRWALWKVFEQNINSGPGIVSYISASSYLDGDAFCAMREHMRRLCDEIWILDLGGEGRGTRQSENVFAIMTPVAIAIAARYGKTDKTTAAKVRYAVIEGTRDDKLRALNAVTRFASIQWEECPDDWQAPFRPAGVGKYFDWPLLTELFPWQQSGVKAGRTWVIAPDPTTLERRWRILCNAEKEKRATLFKDSPTGHKALDSPNQLPPDGGKLKPISELPKTAPPPIIVQNAYRSFDRHFVFADARLLDRPSPCLWATHTDTQMYLTSLFSQPLGSGPAVTACANIPDLDHFRGSYGAKATLPLYRNGEDPKPNIAPGLLETMRNVYRRKVTPEGFVAYVYGLLAQPAFTQRYAKQLGTRELRVPITKNADLFRRLRDVGGKLLWLHTYGQRYIPKGHHRGQVPKGKARCSMPVLGDPANYPETYEYNEPTKTLHVGTGTFAPVAPEVYNFDVSGLKVVQSWLGYRMKNPKGKKSSPLDDIRPEKWTGQFTTELLELLWILEATIAQYPRQAKLLAAVARRPTIKLKT
jgi:predicted helicase